jgi:hypothetical protein
MLPDYRDITSRLGPPLWWDDHGVPRYDPFHPDLCGVYDDYGALLEIACQSCGRRFHVASGISGGFYRLRNDDRAPVLPVPGNSGAFGYGDPPPHSDALGRCPGETMSSDLVRVLEFWRRDGRDMTWRRDPRHEVRFEKEP